RLLALDDAAFDRDIERRLAPRGKMRRISERFSYPVVTVYPSRFAADRYALIGDAALGLHPATAPGLNFGLLAAATLAREVAAARGYRVSRSARPLRATPQARDAPPLSRDERHRRALHERRAADARRARDPDPRRRSRRAVQGASRQRADPRRPRVTRRRAA